MVTALGIDFPDSCKAIHLNSNYSVPAWYNPLHWLQYANVRLLPQLPIFISKEELKGLQRGLDFWHTGRGALSNLISAADRIFSK